MCELLAPVLLGTVEGTYIVSLEELFADQMLDSFQDPTFRHDELSYLLSGWRAEVDAVPVSDLVSVDEAFVCIQRGRSMCPSWWRRLLWRVICRG